MKARFPLWRPPRPWWRNFFPSVALATMMLTIARADDWGLTAPTNAYAVQGSAVRINGIQFTGDPNAGLPTTGPTQIQLTFVAGTGTVHLDCSSSNGVKPINREWFSPGNITAVGTPEEITESFGRGLIYIAPDSAPPMDVLTINAVSSRGGSASLAIVVQARATHLEAWQSTYFTAAELAEPTNETTLWGPGATPAGDGVPNLVKFALNRGPYESVRDMMPKPGLTNNGHTFFADVLCRTDVPGLTNVLQWSTDLLQWQSGPAFLVATQFTAITADLGSTRVQAVADTSAGQQGFIQTGVLLDTPPVVPPPPPPPPFTPAQLAQLQSQLSAMQLVPGDPNQSTAEQRAAARAELRQSHSVVYGALTQTINLPTNCARIWAVMPISPDALILDTLVQDLSPGDWAFQYRHGIEGQGVDLSYQFMSANGQNTLIFSSPYNNRFLFRISYYDTNGVMQQFETQCTGSTDENGAAVAQDDCSRPYYGWPRILISGLAASRFTSGGTDYSDLVDLIRNAIKGMGSTPRTSVVGVTTQQRHGGASFFYSEIDATYMDICPAELMARLQVIASALGATVVRQGDVFFLTGPDAGGRRPNRWSGIWFD
jgi:hypothetical protein